MDVEVRPRSQVSLGYLPAWSSKDGSGSDRVTVRGSSLSATPRSAVAFDGLSLVDAVVWDLDDSSGEGSPGTTSSPSSSSSTPSVETLGFTFSPATKEGGFDFPVKQPNAADPSQRADKRCRHRLDVDGPNTSDLSCKKRRLRFHLITSRLSQPYSQPATHILNREGMKSGDRRFAKIATSLDVARRLTHLQATSFLRFSVMNRLRRRLGLGHPGERYGQDDRAERGHRETVYYSASSSSTKNAWDPQSLPAASKGQYLRVSRDPLAEPSAASGSTASRIGSKMQNCWLSQPAALPVPPEDLAAAKKRTTSRIHPIRSPEMRPDPGAHEELEEDSFAHLHIEDDDDDDDEEGGCAGGGVHGNADHVYSDFSVIFGGSPPQEENHSYEEYLDELDGITWVSL